MSDVALRYVRVYEREQERRRKEEEAAEPRVPPKSVVEAPGPTRLPYQTVTKQVAKHPVVPRAAIEGARGQITTEPVEYYVIPTVPVQRPATWKETTVTGQVYTGEAQLPLLAQIFPWWPRARHPQLTQVVPHEERMVLQPVREFSAGMIGVAESWVRPEVPTPIGAGVGYAIGRPQQAEAYVRGEVSPWYLAGGVVGTYYEAKALGAVAGKVWSGVKKGVSWAARTRVGQPIAQAVKFGPVAKAAHVVKTTVKAKFHRLFLQKAPAVGEVVIPPVPGTGYLYQPSVEILWGKMKAGELAWQMSLAPRTGGVWLGKTAAVATRDISRRATFYAVFTESGKLVATYTRPAVEPLAFVQRETMLTPLVSQQLLTRIGIHPYIPVGVTSAMGKTTMLLGVGVMAGAAVKVSRLKTVTPTRPKRRAPTTLLVPSPSKGFEPTMAWERERLRPLRLAPPVQRLRKRLVPALKVPSTQEMVQVPQTVQVPKVVQRQQQVLKVPPLLAPPELRAPPLTVPPYRRPRGGRDVSPDLGGLYGRWFKREHPIPSPEAVGVQLFGKRKGKGRKGGGLQWF